jgi:PKD repeat protein
MKKLFTLLLIALAAFSFKTSAQSGTVCNADFNSQFITGNTVKFNPVMIGDSLSTHHNWNFGDGGVSTIASPQHTYTTGGSFTVRHILYKTNPNGVVECRDTVYKVIQIQLSPCNLTAYFTWAVDSSNWQLIHFQNQTQPLDPTDSVKWTFGDNSPPIVGLQGNSTVSNPSHQYLNAGTYTVCLRVKKNNNAAGTAPCVSEICKTVIVQQPCNLVANFTWSPAATNPLLILFQNTSVPLSATDSIRWTFGDGTSSSDVNPTHLYAQSGTYTVCLRVKKNSTTPGAAPCVREICKTVVVQSPCNLVANFTWSSTASNPLTVAFQNTSVPLDPTDSVRWTFGDGTSSLLVNPTHTYTSPGTYTVCLRVKKNNNTSGTPCVREICKTVVVQQPCNLHASFTSHADSLNAQKIWFTNTSTGATSLDSVRWTFGDGTSATTYNADHIYAQPGTYTVCLRIIKRNANGGFQTNCISDTCKVIVVQTNCNFQVNWSWMADSINTRKIYFTNQTLSPTAGATAVWNFGDGTSATSWNAVHEYANAGTYTVCLRVYINNTCVREKCMSITVLPPAPPCNNQSNFTAEKFSNDNQKYKFTPAYQNPNAVYTWTFGDGTGSHDIIATHRYAQPGTYTVCLTVWRSATCASTTCKTITVTAQINCNAIQVSYNYQKDPFVPNKVYFYAISNFPLLDQTWTIRKMPLTVAGTPVILHQNNPVYVFQDTGYYQVCLRAITLGGCIKEYCNIIHIEQVAPQCILQAYPNPATSVVNVNVALTQPEMIHTYVYNTMNILVKEKHQQGNTGNNVVTLQIGDLLAGMYNMKIVYGNKTCTSKFQKL